MSLSEVKPAPNTKNGKIISPSNAPFIVSQLKDRNPAESWTLLIYGGFGSGKTHFCGTANPNSTLFINIGLGESTLKSPLFRHMYPAAQEMYIVDVMEQMTDGIVTEARGFDIICQILEWAYSSLLDKGWTIILDDATFMRRMIMNKVRQMAVEGATASTKHKQQSKFEEALNRWVPEDVKDMGKEMDIVEWFIAQHVPRFKALGLNFTMTAHQREVYGKAPQIGEERPLLKTRPGFRGQTFPDQVPLYFDDVFFMKPKSGGTGIGKIYTMRTLTGDNLATKARNGGVFPEIITNPNHQEMLAAIKKSTLHPEWQRKLQRG